MSASFLALSTLYQKKHKDYNDNCCKAVEGLKGDTRTVLLGSLLILLLEENLAQRDS